MNIYEINKRLKQRPPFQMIERVIDFVPNIEATGIKNVSINEPYFLGHFPDTPIMPGVLIIESCAQLSSLVIEDVEKKDNQDYIYVLLKVDGFKFIKPVIPGDTLVINVKKEKEMGPLIIFNAVVKVNDVISAKGNMTFTQIKKESLYQL